jgi:hypothetical protein
LKLPELSNKSRIVTPNDVKLDLTSEEEYEQQYQLEKSIFEEKKKESIMREKNDILEAIGDALVGKVVENNPCTCDEPKID